MTEEDIRVITQSLRDEVSKLRAELPNYVERKEFVRKKSMLILVSGFVLLVIFAAIGVSWKISSDKRDHICKGVNKSALQPLRNVLELAQQSALNPDLTLVPENLRPLVIDSNRKAAEFYTKSLTLAKPISC